MTLLYLDDDQDDLDLFTLAAQPVQGIKQIYTTTSHASFFEKLKENTHKGTIVFLDINMPVKSGFSILKEIREEKEFDRVMVVMHSTTYDTTSVDISRELGADYYSGKPDSIQKLQQIIKTVIIRCGRPVDSARFLIPA